ncbi:MAG: class I tRNA ligase family protein, partial [Turicibacter sp.]|nr:class I tRNA ligase family protein [Turicibacter sp.]
MLSKRLMRDERPVFPKKAVITAGMPYGNKNLHFGHVGGMFVHADIFARFLRDRIGAENVIFVSGTDCYGSPIQESFRRLKEAGYEGSIQDYVAQNHESQKETLKKYGVSLNLYGASALGRSGEIHQEVSNWVFEELYKQGMIKAYNVPQFYDAEKEVFLNGRQVMGRCPIAGCTSEHAYADECSLGHQYVPSELIGPVSVLSGQVPEFRDVKNWYFVLDEKMEVLQERLAELRRNSNTRKFQLNIIDEFLQEPMIHIPRKNIEDLGSLADKLPGAQLIDEEKKKFITFKFDGLDSRDEGRKVLETEGIHYTAGKTLVPFRLTGNVEWGAQVPGRDGLEGLTFWVWPESLWAPISFTQTYLESIGKERSEWTRWWGGEEALVYQFIGEDNIYFYSIAEMGLFYELNQGGTPLDYPHIIPNRHVLFMDTKASSSSAIKPPMADELLEHYTPEQLRMHFMSLALSTKSTGFKPQVYMEGEPDGADMVLKEGNLLTNVFNRLLRSCFYTNQEYFGSSLPQGEPSAAIKQMVEDKVLEYEKHMYNHDFHRIAYVLDAFVRDV